MTTGYCDAAKRSAERTMGRHHRSAPAGAVSGPRSARIPCASDHLYSIHAFRSSPA